MKVLREVHETDLEAVDFACAVVETELCAVDGGVGAVVSGQGDLESDDFRLCRHPVHSTRDLKTVNFCFLRGVVGDPCTLKQENRGRSAIDIEEAREPDAGESLIGDVSDGAEIEAVNIAMTSPKGTDAKSGDGEFIGRKLNRRNEAHRERRNGRCGVGRVGREHMSESEKKGESQRLDLFHALIRKHSAPFEKPRRVWTSGWFSGLVL